MDLDLIDGLWWPHHDRECRPAVLKTFRDMDKALAHVRKWDVAIQAGGNVGVWAQALSKHFDRVVTVEPERENFACLSRNVADYPNILPIHGALGSEIGLCDVEVTPGNAGAHQIKLGGVVPVVTIDSMAARNVGLICLDVEGYELEALKGAQMTLKRDKPVIMLEDKGLSKRYGTEKGDVIRWLADLGYKVAHEVNRDFVLV